MRRTLRHTKKPLALDLIRMIEKLIRPKIKEFKAYESARSLYQKGMLLDANESPFAGEKVAGFPNDLNRYPDPYSTSLREKIARCLGLRKKNIFVGNGSDEIIDLLIRLFVAPGEGVLIFEPTYGLYEILAQLAEREVIRCRLDRSFQINFSEFESRVRDNTKVIFCCSPNNPTGNLLRRKDIEKLCRGFQGIVVVDEAYVEFASEPSLTNTVGRFPNLIVLRTFSKAWGMAGIRVGYAVATSKIINYLDRIKLPYNLNSISSAVAIKVMSRPKAMQKNIERTVSQRTKMAKVLLGLGFFVFPSEANFLLVKKINVSVIFQQLIEKFGIIVRRFAGQPQLKDCIRISIGTSRQNNALIKALSAIL